MLLVPPATVPLITEPGPSVSVLPLDAVEKWIADPPVPVMVPELVTEEAVTAEFRKKIPSTPVIVPGFVIVALLARMAPGVALVTELLIVPVLLMMVGPAVLVLTPFTAPLIVPPLLIVVGPCERMPAELAPVPVMVPPTLLVMFAVPDVVMPTS